MLGAPSCHQLDHAEESYLLYSHFQPSQNLDLYDLLLHEPTNLKRPSVHYDYSPPLQTLDATEELEADSFFTGIKRSPPSSETETAVRRCTCSKTRCLKNYCECFKQGVTCSSACECLSCGNRERLFSARNAGDGKGCTCQKSRCQKNYCECHLNGRRCGPACKCTHCENMDLPQDCLDLGKKSKPSKRRKTNDPQ